jgi:hypothetical protein
MKNGHAKGHHIWEGDGKKKGKYGWCTLYKNEYRIFKLVETTVRKGLR